MQLPPRGEQVERRHRQLVDHLMRHVAGGLPRTALRHAVLNDPSPPRCRPPAAPGAAACGSFVGAVAVIVEVGCVRVAQRAQAADRLGGGEVVAAQDVQVLVLERGEPGDVLVADLVALGAELGDGGFAISRWVADPW
nr:hypothetical protein [Streptomyces ureilyticus]